jgi:hypothetical protein
VTAAVSKWSSTPDDAYDTLQWPYEQDGYTLYYDVRWLFFERSYKGWRLLIELPKFA